MLHRTFEMYDFDNKSWYEWESWNYYLLENAEFEEDNTEKKKATKSTEKSHVIKYNTT